MDSADNPDLAPQEPPETSATPGDKPTHRPPPPPAAAATPRNPKLNWQLTLINIVTLGYLTITATFSIYSAHSDPWTLAFVVSAYATLLALFCFVHAYQAAQLAWKGRMKVVVFALAVLFILIIAYKASSMVPFGFAALIWFITGVGTIVGFYGPFFIEGDDLKSGSGEDGKGEPVSVVVHTGTDDPTL